MKLRRWLRLAADNANAVRRGAQRNVRTSYLLCLEADMTLEQLYRWAKKRDLADLPLYVWDNDNQIEVEVTGQTHDAAEDEGLFSGCCGAPQVGETDLCSECKEHADFEEGLPERIYLKS